ncbi:MAG: response regulator, partial [Myxococcales bacterium]|nr:response regulator [Myxococcales bacterium]
MRWWRRKPAAPPGAADASAEPSPAGDLSGAAELNAVDHAAMREAFARESHAFALARLGTICRIGMIAIVSFSLLDLVVSPLNFGRFFLFRIGAAALAGVALLMTRIERTRRNLLVLGLMAFLPTALVVSLMCQHAGGFTSPYYAALLPVIVGIGFIPWSLGVGAAILTLVVGAYSLPALLGQPIAYPVIFLSHNAHMAAVAVLVLAHLHVSGRLRCGDFQSRWEAAVAHEKLEIAHEQLKEIDIAKSLFFANLSHELRTPITLSLAPVESMLAEKLGSLAGRQREYLGIVHKNMLRLLNLISNLLDFSKVEAGRMKLTLAETDVGELTRELVEHSMALAAARGIAVRMQIAKDLPPIFVDREKYERVLINLLSNALKFTPRGGEVFVRVFEEERHVVLSVRDTGVGIPPNYVDRVFERFAQVEGTTKREYEGTGIGLSLARELVKLHGGTISVESEVGEGSNFTVRLLKGDQIFGLMQSERRQEVRRQQDLDLLTKIQRFEHHGEREDSVAAVMKLGLSDLIEVADSAAERRSLGTLANPAWSTILVVDDNPEITRLLGFLLSDEFNVVKAGDGEEALELVSLHRVDLIISDVMMPRMSGFALTDAIKRHPSYQGIPVILLTTKQDLARRMEGYEHGADDYVAKPFQAEELKARVRVLLQFRRVAEELRRRNGELHAALDEINATHAQLMVSERLASIGRITAGLAHEINNPINAVVNCVDPLRQAFGAVREVLGEYETFIEARAQDFPNQVDALRRVRDRHNVDQDIDDLAMVIDMIERGATRTQEIISNLKTFSHLQRASMQDIDLNEGLRSTLLLISSELKHGPVDVDLDLGEIGTIEGNAGEMNQVFMNLLTNAAQAIEGKGVIRVRTRRTEDDVVVEIADTGHGMTPELVDKIFDPFFTTKEV